MSGKKPHGSDRCHPKGLDFCASIYEPAVVLEKRENMDVATHNRAAWNKESKSGSRWCQPVNSEEICAARQGIWSVILTPNKGVPSDWFGNLKGKRVLCL